MNVGYGKVLRIARAMAQYEKEVEMGKLFKRIGCRFFFTTPFFQTILTFAIVATFDCA
jgi:hypothetical protein